MPRWLQALEWAASLQFCPFVMDKCVIQLIIFCELNPCRGSAAVGEGKGELCVVCITVLVWNLYCMLRLVLESMSSDHFNLQFTCRYWQNSRKPVCPWDAPRDRADRGGAAILRCNFFGTLPGKNTDCSEYLSVKRWLLQKKSKRAWIDRCQLSERQV